MKKTFKELQEVDQIVGSIYQKTPTLRESKFGYAYKRFTDKNYVPLVNNFNDELSSLRVQHALEDPNTHEVLIDRMNPRGFKYSKAGLMELMAAEKALTEAWDIKEFDIIPYLSAMIPEELDEDQREVLDGIVL